MKSGIYTIINRINNKVYVGESINAKYRLGVHKAMLKGGYHSNIYLQRAVNKYGIENFEFEILELCAEKFLKSNEHYWCNMFNSYKDTHGYNLDINNPNTGVRRKSEKVKKVISDKARARNMTGERNPFYGKTHSKEARVSMGIANKGRKLTEYHKKILSEKAKERKSGKHPDSKKVINALSGKIYDSIKECATENNLNYTTLKFYLSGRLKNKTNFKLYE